jgi:hypothetical protein
MRACGMSSFMFGIFDSSSGSSSPSVVAITEPASAIITTSIWGLAFWARSLATVSMVRLVTWVTFALNCLLKGSMMYSVQYLANVPP